MTPESIIEAIRLAGGMLQLVDGERLRYRLPERLSPLVDVIREKKPEIIELLSRCPAMPPGVRLVRWETKTAPIQISQCETVIEVDGFVRTTLRQVEARLQGKHWQSGNWTLSTLIERLAAVGCHVALNNPREAVQ